MSETASPNRPRPVVLCILDGWGARAEPANNAIALGDTPNWDRYMETCPHAHLDASGTTVGLPDAQMGNSEVGHMTIGAGRSVLQDLPRIDTAIADGDLATNPALGDLIARLQTSGGTCHLMGLVSPGGVHSHQDHIVFLARHVAAAGVPVAIHAFLDGRDTPPRSAAGFMAKFVDDLDGAEGITIATVGGRYYTMDRDNRWERVERAYDALVAGAGETAADPLAAIEASYGADVSDEFMLPTVIGAYGGMVAGDGLLMANFRADRVRQVLSALVAPAFDGFQRRRVVASAARVGVSEYSTDLNEFLATMLASIEPRPVLGEVVADAGLTQLRIAETEKYALPAKSASWYRRRRSPPTTSSRPCRRPKSRTGWSRRSHRTPLTWSSSTTPTVTWWVIRESCPPRSRRPLRSMPASAVWRRR
jgi:2,3-bisphosphoglycerate-independent phosphoglycerate mutase